MVPLDGIIWNRLYLYLKKLGEGLSGVDRTLPLVTTR